jgi:nucleotide-binding universal stress UspA family protein
MDYKTILLHARADAASRARTELAMRVAEMFDATIYGVAAEIWVPALARPEFGYAAAGGLEDLEQKTLGRLEAARSAFEELASKSDRAFLCASIEDHPREALVWAAQAADLVVADRSQPADLEGLAASPADLVMATGLPVLLMADGLPTIRAERVVVAWKNTREARQAVSNALPFLRRAKEVHLVQVTHESELETACRDLDEAAGRLTRHGLAVHTHALTESRDVCEALEVFAKSKGADLIVLGAYGHSRLRELVFGGVTQGFLNRGSLHVLLSR